MTSPPSPPSTLDVSALTRRFDRAASHEFFDSDDPAAVQLRERVGGRLRRYRTLAILGAVAFLIGLGLYAFVPTDDDRLHFTLTVGGLISIITFGVEHRRSGARHAYRIERFAEANGFTFSHLEETAGYEGMLFTNGWDHHRWMIVKAEVGGRPVEFGNLSFVEGGARTYSRRRGYIAIRLPAHLPRMVITTRSVPLLSATIPEYPHRDERVDVGQGRAFRVYAPEGSEHVVRALLTPDVVPTIAELAKRYTIEIAGDALFLYRFRAVSTAHAGRWRRQFADVEDLCRVLNTSLVWQVMSSYPRGFLGRLPEIRLHGMVTRPVLLAVITVGVIVLVSALITIPIVLHEIS